MQLTSERVLGGLQWILLPTLRSKALLTLPTSGPATPLPARGSTVMLALHASVDEQKKRKHFAESMLQVCTDASSSSSDVDTHAHCAKLLYTAASMGSTMSELYATMTKQYPATSLRDHILGKAVSPAAAAGASRAFSSLYGVIMGLHMSILSPAPAASDLNIYPSSGIVLLSSVSALRPQIVAATASTGDDGGKKKLGTSAVKSTMAPSNLPHVRMTRNVAAFIGAPNLAGHAVVSLGCTRMLLCPSLAYTHLLWRAFCPTCTLTTRSVATFQLPIVPPYLQATVVTVL